MVHISCEQLLNTTGIYSVGYRIGQVRCIFKVPKSPLQKLLPHADKEDFPEHLAYIEWFSPFMRPDPNHGLYKVARSFEGEQRLASVVDIKDVRRSCQLWPDFGPVAPREWWSSNVLERCPSFFVNAFSDLHAYQIVF